MPVRWNVVRNQEESSESFLAARVTLSMHRNSFTPLDYAPHLLTEDMLRTSASHAEVGRGQDRGVGGPE